MGREGLQIAIDRLETIERRFPAQRRAGGFDRVGAVHTDEGVQVLQRLTLFFLAQQQQGLQAARGSGTFGAEDRSIKSR